MATVVDDFPTGGGRTSSYPYEEWMDGEVWELVRGVDFTSTPEGMRSSLHNYAKRNGIKVKTRIRDENVYVQCIEPDEDGEN